jgi:hypothetical protein
LVPDISGTLCRRSVGSAGSAIGCHTTLQGAILNHQLFRCLLLSIALAALPRLGESASAALLTYQYAGVVTDVFLNENNAIPGLTVGDSFTGYTTFEATGWHHTAGTVFASINGVDLFFTGNYVYGNVEVQPAAKYSIRIAADAGGSITGSTFSAGNFGPELIDSDGSAGYATPFPPSLDLNQFETNVFLVSGTILATNQRLSITGTLTEFSIIPEPTSSALIAFAIGAIGGVCRTARPSRR